MATCTIGKSPLVTFVWVVVVPPTFYYHYNYPQIIDKWHIIVAVVTHREREEIREGYSFNRDSTDWSDSFI